MNVKTAFNRRAFQDAADDLKSTFHHLALDMEWLSGQASPPLDQQMRTDFAMMLQVRSLFHDWSEAHAQRVTWAEQIGSAKELDELVIQRFQWKPRPRSGEPLANAESRLRGMRLQAIRRATRFYERIMRDNGSAVTQSTVLPVSQKVVSQQYGWRKNAMTKLYLRGLDRKSRALGRKEAPDLEELQRIDRNALVMATEYAADCARTDRWAVERWMREDRRDRAVAARWRRDSRPHRTDEEDLDRYRRNEIGAGRQAARLRQLERAKQLERPSANGHVEGYKYLPPTPSGFERDAHGYVATSSEPEAIRLRVLLLKQKCGDVTIAEKMDPGQLLMLEASEAKAVADHHEKLRATCADTDLWAAFLGFELQVALRLTPPRRPTAAAVVETVRARLAPHQFPRSMTAQMLVDKFGSRFGGLTPNARGGGARKKRGIDAATRSLAKTFEKEVRAQIDIETAYRIVLAGGGAGASERDVHAKLGGRKDLRAKPALRTLKDDGRIDDVDGRWVATLSAVSPKSPEFPVARG